jgi:putative transferase (TIGR04331 family)
MIKRYLITTADERSWKFDRPVLFLGEWCRRYDRKHIWSEMDAIVAEPYGLEPGQKWRDVDYFKMLSCKILIELTELLNKFHQVQHSERYWNIVLGRWLQCYVSVVFHRYHSLEQALKTHEVAGTSIFDAKDYSSATSNTLNSIIACNDDLWNHVLYSKLMAYRGDIELNLTIAPLQCKGFKHEEKRSDGVLPQIKRFARELWNMIGSKLVRNTDAFIISSYLPIKEEIKLQLALGQVPQLWRSPTFQQTVSDTAQRANLVLNYGKYKGFERYVRWQLPEFIPTCYLEGYKRLVKTSESLLWPVKPRFIFTSNNFDADEIFKAWTGSKVEQGIPYFIGQHGNHYGTQIGNQKSPERMTADKFITWGWTDDSKKNIPAFIFKTIGKPKAINPNGGLLLIEVSPPHMPGPSDDYYEYGIYQEEQFRFAELLPVRIQQQLTVRLKSDFTSFRWHPELRWKVRNPNTKLETGATSIWQLIAQSRLVIHSYDSTGILETLSLNIPTMCFWRGGLDHLLPSAKPYYELLRSAGIFSDTTNLAAERVALYWDNIDAWWESQKVQDARKAFISRFARVEKHPVRVLKKLLIQEVSHGFKK